MAVGPTPLHTGTVLSRNNRKWKVSFFTVSFLEIIEGMFYQVAFSAHLGSWVWITLTSQKLGGKFIPPCIIVSLATKQGLRDKKIIETLPFYINSSFLSHCFNSSSNLIFIDWLTIIRDFQIEEASSALSFCFSHDCPVVIANAVNEKAMETRWYFEQLCMQHF